MYPNNTMATQQKEREREKNQTDTSAHMLPNGVLPLGALTDSFCS